MFANATVAIFGVLESRNAFEKKPEALDTDALRIQLYRLMQGNWNATLIDIGDIEPGDSVEDTYFVVNQVVAELLEENIIPIILGATQDITFPYRAFDNIEMLENLVLMIAVLILVKMTNWFHRILHEQVYDKPNNLNNFSNLGYQTYFNAQEEIDLMGKLFFDSYRLGEITQI